MRIDRRQAPRRVAHITTAHHGDDVRIYEREARSLAAAGLDVVLVGPATTGPLDNVELVAIPPAPRSRARRFGMATWRAASALRGLDVSVYHFHDPELIPLAVALARRGRVVVWDAHEDYLTKFATGGSASWAPGTARPWIDRLVRGLISQIDRDAAAVVAATPRIASSYRNARTVVVGNEARLSDFAGCDPEWGNQSVLFTGHADGPAHLFSEVVEATAEFGDLRLLVAGRPVDPRTWRAATAVLGDRVQHVGWLGRGALRMSISQSVLGFATYAPMPTYQDPSISPTKVFEFAASGLPIVVTPNPAMERLVGSSGLGVVADGFTSSDLVRAMREALATEADWRDMSERGRRWAQKHSWESGSESALISLYLDVILAPTNA